MWSFWSLFVGTQSGGGPRGFNLQNRILPLYLSMSLKTDAVYRYVVAC